MSEKNNGKYSFDFSEIIARIPAAEANRKKVKESVRKSKSESPLVRLHEIQFEKLGFISSMIVTTMADRELQVKDWTNYCLTSPLLSRFDEAGRRSFANNAIMGIRNGQKFLEDKLEVFLDFLKLEMILRSTEDGKEER